MAAFDQHQQHTRPDFLSLAQEIVSGQVRARRAVGPAGVCWSAMAPERPAVLGLEETAQRLEAQYDQREAFFATPRGRFVRAVNSLGALGYGEADTLLNIYGRSMADPSRELDALSIDALARCVRILADVGHSDALVGIRALADLLARPLAEAA